MRASTILAGALALLAGGCASTSYMSTWKNPEAVSPVEITGRKVVVVAADMPRSVKLAVEGAVSDELKKSGVDAISSVQVLAPGSGVEAAKEKLARDGFDAAVVIRMTDKQQEVYTTPGVYAPYPRYRSYWAWGGGYGAYPAAEIRTDTKVYVETLVYSVKSDQLAWSGLSSTTNPASIDSFSRELITVALAEMKKSGLIK